jgi:AmiR/NasT family two-component response regulator
MRAVLRVDSPLLRDVFEHALREAGIDVVGCPVDFLALLLAIKERRADVLFLLAADSDNPAKEPGICSHLLSEFPQLKIVMVSTGGYAITDVGIRTMHCHDLSAESIRSSLQSLLAD